MFDNRRWLVIPTSITGSIDFNEVIQSSAEVLRTSVDGSLAIVKYDINEVTSSYTLEYVNAETGTLETTEISAGVYGRPSFYSTEFQEYKYDEIINLMKTADWHTPI